MLCYIYYYNVIKLYFLSYCIGLIASTNTHLGLSSVCVYSCDVAVTTELQGYIDRTGRPTLHINE